MIKTVTEAVIRHDSGQHFTTVDEIHSPITPRREVVLDLMRSRLEEVVAADALGGVQCGVVGLFTEIW